MIFSKKTQRVIGMSKYKRGFTFMEIMFVVVIIGILLGLVGPKLVGKSKKAKIKAAEAQISNFKTSLNSYEMNVGEFPSTSQGLKALVERPSDVEEDDWEGPYMDDIPKDPWNREYIYKSPGEHNKDFDLSSMGPDRQEGTEDDITNWKKQSE